MQGYPFFWSFLWDVHMSAVSKRSYLKLAALAAATVLVVGCGQKKDAPAPAAAPASAPKAEPFKAAWVYIGPVGDAGWTYAHDLGRKAVEAKLGDKVKTTVVEKVDYGSGERVIRELATAGNKVIFATSFGYMEAMLKVAKEFPDVKFEHATGFKTADNMNAYDARFYQDSYMAGVIAGKMTKSNTLGFVGSFPIPEVLRNINAYTLGAQSVNPKIKTKVVWIGAWFDPQKESDAAQSLINGGADVLLQNTDSTAVLQTAEKNGKLAFGWDSDMSAFAPKAHLGSAIVDWSGYYTEQVEAAMNNTWKGNQVTRRGVKEGQNDLIKISDLVPAETKAKVEEIKAGMKAGTFEVFTGPITDNTGKVVLEKGKAADDAWKGEVKFFVKGVEGKVPDSK
jgi:basic membrane protein A and related proteins